MEEKLVQWVLLKDQEYLAKILNLRLSMCLGTEITTRYGRVDFMFRVGDQKLLVIELETGIDSTSKLKHCMSQVERYIKLKNQYRTKALEVAIVFAKDKTPERFILELKRFAAETGIILRAYSIQNVLQLYNKMVNQLNHTSGISLSRAVALGITSISWIKKFMIPFLIMNNETHIGDLNKLLNDIWLKPDVLRNWVLEFQDNGLIDTIPWKELKGLFSSNTNFYVLKRLVEDFELIEIKNINKTRQISLTESGRRFRNEQFIQFQMQFQTHSSLEEVLKELTIGQKRILLEILLNGNFTKIKVNIFHFLRFIHLNEGDWLPKSSTKLSSSECQYLNNLFNSSYRARTLKELTLQTCMFCEELGLVNKLIAADQLYDKVMFTTLGSRVYNHFEMLLHVERERYQIPLQVA